MMDKLRDEKRKQKETNLAEEMSGEHPQWLAVLPPIQVLPS